MRTSLLVLLLSSIAIPSVTNAWDMGGGVGIAIDNTTAHCVTWVTVSRFENLIDEARASCTLKEEGIEIGTDTKTCDWVGGVGISCIAKKTDPTVTALCEYCGKGWGEISKVLLPWFQDRRIWPNPPVVWECRDAGSGQPPGER